MEIRLPENVADIIGRLEAAGHTAYAVGGCVRDSLLGRVPQDWDVTTSARPEQMHRIFARIVDTGIEHGTVTVLYGKEGYEVTTYRIDGEYEDSRHPKEVTFTEDLREDLSRRDFTINALAYHPRTGIVDLFDGIGDLKRGVIRCVGNPQLRFREDALRVMRAVRFAAQLGFTIDPETARAISDLAPTLSKVSAERVREELVKLILSDHPEHMQTLYDTGITDVILPEFSVMMMTYQHNPHHGATVGEHTIRTLQHIRADKTLRLTMLFHDVSKPECLVKGPDGIDHFYQHPIIGAERTRGIMRRLKFDNDTIDAVTKRVRFHDDRLRSPDQIKSVRRFMSRIGVDMFPDFFCICRADVLGQSDYMRDEKLRRIDTLERVCYEVLRENSCLTLKDLAVNGSDLIEAGMRPGPEIGRVLYDMLNAVVDDPTCNKKDILLRRFLD